ncbi:MAG: GTP-binding protein [Lautropia sp.]|nr:GTP-binding protein [Lautropia sp.]
MIARPDPAPACIPVTLLTGFLGAGKTSWLNQQLAAGRLPANSLILVNDFGRLQIDASLIVAQDEQIIRLADGCICCTLGDNLAAQLSDIARREVRPAALYIEGSGVADPRRLQAAVRLNRHFSLAECLCVVDASAAERLSREADTAGLWRAQIQAASRVIINRQPVTGLPAVLQQVLGMSAAPAEAVPLTPPASLELHRMTSPAHEPATMVAASPLHGGGGTREPGPTGSARRIGDEAQSAVADAKDHLLAMAGRQPGTRSELFAGGYRMQGTWQGLSFSQQGALEPAALEAVLAQYADVVLRAKGWLRCEPDGRWQVFQFTPGQPRWLPSSHRPEAGQLACVGRPGSRLRQCVAALLALGLGVSKP